MITTSVSPFVLEQGSDQSFDGSLILCEPTYLPVRQIWAVTLRILGSATNIELLSSRIDVTKAEADAKTGTGTGDTAKALNAVEQVVKDKLSAISDNSGVTFTIV